MADLLPPNATPMERAFAAAAQALFAGLDVPLRLLWRPDECPAPLLPWLGWALSVDVWRADWSEARKRQAIKSALQQHRTKGSVGSVRRALADQGYPTATIHEGAPPTIYDGAALYDGSKVYAGGGSWAQYAVEVEGGMTAAEFEALGEALGAVAPARCHLVSLTETPDPSAPRYDAAHTYDGAIAYS